MKEKEYLAHRTEDGHNQTIKEHLEGTAELCASFAASFGAEDAGRVCGLAHDIGKYSPGFQRRILEDGKKVDHASAGAIECWNRGEIYASLCVMGHHSGLLNVGTQDDLPDAPTFFGRMNRYTHNKAYDYSAWKKEIIFPSSEIPEFESDSSVMFYTRMLYSCLVDADFLDTAAFMGEARTGCSSDFDELQRRFDSYTQKWYPPKSELNHVRCEILDACKSCADETDSSLFTLTVPTGGGKTIASLAFALHHARKMKKDRIIYVIPYTAIIEQTADVFREVLGDDMVLEHHSGVVYEEEGDFPLSERQKRLKHATENWDMPVIVTTAVQFFESLFHNRSSHCRKLHNIANSVVIFDEAQMLPLPYLRPCVYAIAELTRAYKTTAVLCTATQPSLDHLFYRFIGKMPEEICPTRLRQVKLFKRVSFGMAGRLSLEDLADRLNEKHQVLCIVNTRKTAQELFSLLGDKDSFHLSTLMPPAERQKQLREIRHLLDKGAPCRVVSTSLIEAGVDVDFPCVYREMAGLDSILQATGRCNREGKRPREESDVLVFELDRKPPKALEIAIGACRIALQSCQDPSDEDTIRRYFEEYRMLSGEEWQDVHRILARSNNSTLPFADIAQDFNLIESNAVTIYIPTEESRPLIEQYRCGFISRSLMRRLGRFGVTVYPHHLQKLLDAGDVEVLDGETYVLINEQLYDEKIGLSIEADQGKAIFI